MNVNCLEIDASMVDDCFNRTVFTRKTETPVQVLIIRSWAFECYYHEILGNFNLVVVTACEFGEVSATHTAQDISKLSHTIYIDAGG